MGENVPSLSTLVIKPEIESIEYKVVNERKFKAKITVLLGIREYTDVEADCFRGGRHPKIQDKRAF